MGHRRVPAAVRAGGGALGARAGAATGGRLLRRQARHQGVRGPLRAEQSGEQAGAAVLACRELVVQVCQQGQCEADQCRRGDTCLPLRQVSLQILLAVKCITDKELGAGEEVLPRPVHRNRATV